MIPKKKKWHKKCTNKHLLIYISHDINTFCRLHTSHIGLVSYWNKYPYCVGTDAGNGGKHVPIRTV